MQRGKNVPQSSATCKEPRNKAMEVFAEIVIFFVKFTILRIVSHKTANVHEHEKFARINILSLTQEII